MIKSSGTGSVVGESVMLKPFGVTELKYRPSFHGTSGFNIAGEINKVVDSDGIT